MKKTSSESKVKNWHLFLLLFVGIALSFLHNGWVGEIGVAIITLSLGTLFKREGYNEGYEDGYEECKREFWQDSENKKIVEIIEHQIKKHNTT